MKRILSPFLVAVAILASAAGAFAQGTAFTYQGRLFDAASPANGEYDLRFTLYDAGIGGLVVAGPLTKVPTAVSNGLFMVTLDFGAGMFTGPARWLEIGARSNGVAVAYTVLSSRQQLTPTPYAITAENLDGTLAASQLTGTLPGGLLGGTYGGALTFNNAGNSFTGDGSGLANVNAARLGGLTAAGFWQLTGNAGTTPGVNFLGTPDNNALEFKVNNARGLRLEPDPTFSTPSVIGGSAANFVGGGSVGNFIGAGGQTGFATNYITGGNLNMIGGGWDNHITNGLEHVIAGGAFNTVGSGGGGTIGGGNNNTVNGSSATVPGGYNNQALGDYSFAAGQDAQALHDGAFVWADHSSSTPFASAAPNQFLVRSSFLGLNRNTRVSSFEYFGIYAPAVSNWVGMYIQGSNSSRPFYGYDNPAGAAWTEVDGTDANKWKLFNSGYQMTVTTAGQVGIGTTTPTETLEINGTSRIDDNDMYLRAGTDRNHGLGYRNSVYGIFTDGPFLYGYNGGGLGTSGPDEISLKWDYVGNVWISNNLSAASLTIRNDNGGGAIHVTGAGIGTSTAAFIHVATVANASGSDGTAINNSLCNGDPNAILFVTANLTPNIVRNNHAVGVWYSPSISKWVIFNQDVVAIPINAAFNVLVIKN